MPEPTPNNSHKAVSTAELQDIHTELRHIKPGCLFSELDGRSDRANETRTPAWLISIVAADTNHILSFCEKGEYHKTRRFDFKAAELRRARLEENFARARKDPRRMCGRSTAEDLKLSLEIIDVCAELARALQKNQW